MSILLTNGTYYIAHSKKGAVVKVSDIKKAQDFYSVERAIAQKNKTPGKCASYYFIDTDKMEQETVPEEKKEKPKRKKRKHKAFSMQKRLKIYRKTEGHCYLCGEFVDFNSFEVEHNIPVSKGGTNELDNLFCACHCCNAIKHDITSAIKTRIFNSHIFLCTQVFCVQTSKLLFSVHFADLS